MKSTIKCCISCILPCGSLDVIRIVHLNGRVEEISGTVKASEIMKAYPKHVLKIPSSPSYSDDGTVSCPEIVILSPESELRRGKIYFLMPVPPSTQKSRSKTRKKKKEACVVESNGNGVNSDGDSSFSDRYLTEILSETARDRRRGRAGVWRPHLESICEGINDA